MALLEIEDLFVEVEGKKVLNGVNLRIEEGEVHVLMGPNGSGKSSLIFTLLGYPYYKITKGRIRFKGIELKDKPIYERVKLGIGVAYQSPPEIRGVRLRDLIRLAGGMPIWDPFQEPEESFASPLLTRVGLPVGLFRDREVNVGFSGGERKRSELAQVFAGRPGLMVLDEPDSGVDIDSLKKIGRDLGDYIGESKCSCLVITHYRHILPYLRPDLAHVMCGGRILVTGDPMEIFTRIEEKGYCAYLELCPAGIKEEVEKGMGI